MDSRHAARRPSLRASSGPLATDRCSRPDVAEHISSDGARAPSAIRGAGVAATCCVASWREQVGVRLVDTSGRTRGSRVRRRPTGDRRQSGPTVRGSSAFDRGSTYRELAESRRERRRLDAERRPALEVDVREMRGASRHARAPAAHRRRARSSPVGSGVERDAMAATSPQRDSGRQLRGPTRREHERRPGRGATRPARGDVAATSARRGRDGPTAVRAPRTRTGVARRVSSRRRRLERGDAARHRGARPVRDDGRDACGTRGAGATALPRAGVAPARRRDACQRSSCELSSLRRRSASVRACAALHV